MSIIRFIDVYCPNCGKFLSAKVNAKADKAKLPRHEDDFNACSASGKSFGLPSWVSRERL